MYSRLGVLAFLLMAMVGCASRGGRSAGPRGQRVPDCDGAVAVITNMADGPLEVWVWPQRTPLGRVPTGTSYVPVGGMRGSWLVFGAPWPYSSRHARSRAPATVVWRCP